MNTVTGGVYKQLGEKWDVTLLDDQEWTKNGWDWIIG
jgi:hypothetical protein